MLPDLAASQLDTGLGSCKVQSKLLPNSLGEPVVSLTKPSSDNFYLDFKSLDLSYQETTFAKGKERGMDAVVLWTLLT